MELDYDAIIVGSGPAGMTAAIFLARAGLRTAVFEQNTLGGAIVNVELVENFPSYPNGISGSDLSVNVVNQAMKYGAEIKLCSVDGIGLLPDGRRSVKSDEGDFTAKAIIIASGTTHRKLGIPGEEAFEGNGVSYCAYCDGNKFTGKEVVVIGGGDSGVTEALYLSRITKKVTLIELLPRLSTSKVLENRIKENSRIQVFLGTALEEIEGEDELRVLKLRNVEGGELWSMKTSGIFVRIGITPQNDYFRDLVELDDFGFILVNQNMETNVPGIFAAGDIRTGSPRQWVTAAGDGAIAGISAGRYISQS